MADTEKKSEASDRIYVSVPVACAVMLITLLVGVLLAYTLSNGLPKIPDVMPHPVPAPAPTPHRPLLPDRDRAIDRWIPSSDKNVQFGLKKDNTIIWDTRRNTGESNPAGDAPIGDAPAK